MTDESEEGYFWTEGKKYLLIFVEPAPKGRVPTGLQPLNALRETVAAVKADFRDINAGVTGQKALDEDEKNLAMRDIGLATILSLIGLAVLLIVFWRGIIRPLLAVAVLVIALCVTFGLTTLFIGHLNLLSVTFAPMLLGLGIDYAVHWFARYHEERRRFFASAAQALVATMDQVGPAIILAGLCASLSFFPLVLTGFKGLSELGLICSMGLLAATAASLFLLPALIVLVGRLQKGLIRKPLAEQIKPLLKTTRLRTVILLGIAVCASALSIWGASKVRFDLNMLHLQSKTAESVIWENKLIQGSRYASIYGVLFAHSFKEIDEKTRAAERLPTVSKVNSVKNVLPSDQERKIGILREMKPLLENVRSIPMPTGPVDTERLDSVFARIRFKMLDSGPSETGVSKPLLAQMQEVGQLIDAVRRDFNSIERSTLLGRLKKFEAMMIADLNDKLSLLWENIGDESAPARRPAEAPGRPVRRSRQSLHTPRLSRRERMGPSVSRQVRPATGVCRSGCHGRSCDAIRVYENVPQRLRHGRRLCGHLHRPPPRRHAAQPGLRPGCPLAAGPGDPLDPGPDAPLRHRPEPRQYHLHAPRCRGGRRVRDHRRPAVAAEQRPGGIQPSRKHRHGRDPRRAFYNGRLLQPDHIDAPGHTLPRRAHDNREPLRPCGGGPLSARPAARRDKLAHRRRKSRRRRSELRGRRATANIRRNHEGENSASACPGRSA